MDDMSVMTRQQVRDFDRYAIEKLGIAGVVLMENAGRNCCNAIIEHLRLNASNSQDILNKKLCIICGTGNNGGDGFVIARFLSNKGFAPEIVITGNRSKIKGDAETNLKIIEKMQLPITYADKITTEELAKYDLIIDAIFGTGLKGSVKPEYVPLIKAINSCPADIISVDIPSGLDCDEGTAEPVAVKAVKTITFVAVKKGFTCPAAEIYTGKVIVADIGIAPEFIRKFYPASH